MEYWDPADTAVIYNEHYSIDTALAFWTLEYYRHKDVRILNGDWSHWLVHG
ncbi:hypothetical protein KEJ39_02585 [Candidatus Bathyarchaeota archaeon]|nr:hypothetical protein [Candidatus Bathyarchaeota archaeon]